MSQLKPPIRFRMYVPRSCGTCRFGTLFFSDDEIDMMRGCKRDPEHEIVLINLDDGSSNEYWCVCERYEQYKVPNAETQCTINKRSE